MQRELELINESLGRYAVEVVHGHGRFAGPARGRGDAARRGRDPHAHRRLLRDRHRLAAEPARRRAVRRRDGVRQRDDPAAAAHAEDDDRPRRRCHRHRVREHLRRARHRGDARRHARPDCCPTSTARSWPCSSEELRPARGDDRPRRPLRARRALHRRPAARALRDAGGPHARVRRAALLRRAATATPRDIGLGTLGIKPGRYGLLEVNESYQTVHPHIYAVGDVIGYPGPRQHLDGAGPAGDAPRLPHPGAQGPDRGAALRHLLDPRGRLRRRDRGVARSRREPTTWPAARSYDKNPRGQIIGATGGVMKLALRAPVAAARRRARRRQRGERDHPRGRGVPPPRAPPPTTSPSCSTTTRRCPTCTATPRSRRWPRTAVGSDAGRLASRAMGAGRYASRRSTKHFR